MSLISALSELQMFRVALPTHQIVPIQTLQVVGIGGGLLGIGLNVLENGVGFAFEVPSLGRGSRFGGYALLRDGGSSSGGRG